MVFSALISLGGLGGLGPAALATEGIEVKASPHFPGAYPADDHEIAASSPVAPWLQGSKDTPKPALPALLPLPIPAETRTPSPPDLAQAVSREHGATPPSTAVARSALVSHPSSPDPPAAASEGWPLPPEVDPGSAGPLASDDDPDGGEGDPELGIIRVRNPLEDPELGILRIREQPPLSPPPTKIAFLTTRFSAVSSDNVLLVENEVGGLTGDRFYRPAASVAIYPSLGPQTLLIGELDLGLQRYGQRLDLDYSGWQARLALRQELSPRAYAQLSLAYQELLRTGGFRFFDNRSVALSLGRSDPLAPNLTLDSFYQVQWNQAQARSQAIDGSIFTTDFSRLSHTAGAYLGYTPTARWHTGISYQINRINYSTQDRQDTVQQLLGQVVYSLTPRVRLSLYGGRSFGRSSDPRLRLNDTIFGFTIDATVPLF